MTWPWRTTIKVYCGNIAWRAYEAGNVHSMLQLKARYPQIVVADHVGDALVERARSVVASAFLKTNADVLLTIDSDIVFATEAAVQLCEQAMTHDIVCAAYVTRSAEKTKLTSTMYDGTIEFGDDPTPVPIYWGASGFMAIHRRVLEKLVESDELKLCHAAQDFAFHPFYHTTLYEGPETGRILLSEDYAFCERARRAGFDIYLNPAIRLGHIGSYEYRMEDMLTKPLPAQPLRITQTGKNYRVETIGEEDASEPSQGTSSDAGLVASRDRR